MFTLPVNAQNSDTRAKAIQAVIDSLRRCAAGGQAFSLTVSDPAGKSFISNPYFYAHLTVNGLSVAPDLPRALTLG